MAYISSVPSENLHNLVNNRNPRREAEEGGEKTASAALAFGEKAPLFEDKVTLSRNERTGRLEAKRDGGTLFGKLAGWLQSLFGGESIIYTRGNSQGKGIPG